MAELLYRSWMNNGSGLRLIHLVGKMLVGRGKAESVTGVTDSSIQTTRLTVLTASRSNFGMDRYQVFFPLTMCATTKINLVPGASLVFIEDAPTPSTWKQSLMVRTELGEDSGCRAVLNVGASGPISLVNNQVGSGLTTGFATSVAAEVGGNYE